MSARTLFGVNWRKLIGLDNGFKVTLEVDITDSLEKFSADVSRGLEKYHAPVSPLVSVYRNVSQGCNATYQCVASRVTLLDVTELRRAG